RRSRSSRKTSATACSRPASARRSVSPRPPSRVCRCSSTSRTAWQLSPTGNSRRRFSPMANAKRASMREGPLAALFRKTEELEGEAQGNAEERAEEPSRKTAEGTAASGAARTRRSQTGRAASPHPALGDVEELEDDTIEERVPTPQERLRHAFSSELPSDL